MRELELLLLLLAVSAGIQILARRISVPYPSLLVIGGLLLALVPGLPRIARDPELIFLIFIPPLLYWSAATLSIRDLRDVMWPVVRLATFLVLITMCVVAVAIHMIEPRFTWATAFLLGAIVAPPDPVAASAVMRSVGNSQVRAVLEGEGLFNDATALVAYRIALAAVLTGTFSIGQASVHLVTAGVGGVAIGLAIGWVIAFLRKHMFSQVPIVENTLSLLTPFITYIPADAVGASGVLAVVAGAIYLTRKSPEVMTPASRIQAEAMWTMVTFILESVVFIIVGLELRYVVQSLSGAHITHLILEAVIVTVVCIAVRFAWVMSSVVILRTLRRRRGAKVAPPWNVSTMVAWTGMRGADSLVIALAIPFAADSGRAVPARELIIFITFGVILITLVVQGLTLVPVARMLRLEEEEAGEDATEEAIAREARAAAATREIDAIMSRGGPKAEIARRMRDRYARRQVRWSETLDATDDDATASERKALDKWDRYAEDYGDVRERVIEAERKALLELYGESRVGDDVLRRLQRELDLESMLLDSSQSGDELEGMTSPFEIADE